MIKKVLFVDDETRVLDALQRMLRPFRSELDVFFASSGEEALALLSAVKFDIVISDIRMPGMGGAELLERVKKEHPDTIRFALSGQSDQETWMRALGSAHQFLSKPCSAEKLRSAILQASSLRERLRSERVRNIVSGTGALPSVPRIYQELMAVMQKPDCSVSEIAASVERDVAMSAKVLQLVNSAAMGLHSHVSSPAQAVSLLGLGALRAMILLVHIFDNFRVGDPLIRAFLESFHVHSLAVAQASRRIAQAESQDKNLIQEASIAGMLHDVGRLIFANHFPSRYAKLVKDEEGGAPDFDLIAAETSEFGASHQETGAYLLAIWGLSDPVVEAVAYHHAPSLSSVSGFSALAAVHVSECLLPVQPSVSPGLPPRPPLPVDKAFLERIGFSSKLDGWRAALGAFAAPSAEPFTQPNDKPKA